MPIDFNSHIYFVNNNRPFLQNVVNSNYIANQPVKDTFVKSVSDNSIKIEKRHLVKLKKQIRLPSFIQLLIKAVQV